MQTPTIIFDHVNGVVVHVGSKDSVGSLKLAELLAAQRGNVTTAAGSPKQ